MAPKSSGRVAYRDTESLGGLPIRLLVGVSLKPNEGFPCVVGVFPVLAKTGSLIGVLLPCITNPDGWADGVDGMDLDVPSTSSAENVMKVASISRLG